MSEIARKSIHLSTLFLGVVAYHYGTKVVLWLVIPIATLAIVADILRTQFPTFQAFIEKYFGFMMRDNEAGMDQISLNGATYLLIAASLTFALFPKIIAIAAFSILVLGDAAAALIGKKWGKMKLGNTGKSLEGAVGFMVACSFIYFAIPEIGVIRLTVGAIVGAIVEILPLPINDNLRIPICAGLVMMLV